MSLLIREMTPADAEAFLQVHHSAVRKLAAKDYAPEIVEVWAPIPVTENAVQGFRANPDNELRLVAVTGRDIVGIAALVLEKSELRACYVAPEHARTGIGTALVRAMERIALEHGLSFLEFDSSITAEPFYAALGYEVVERGQHILHSGQPMKCVRMRKTLARVAR